MATDPSQRRFQREKRRRRAQSVRRWLVDEVFLSPHTRRFQYRLSALFIAITWIAFVLGTSLWLGPGGGQGTFGEWLAIALVAILGAVPLAGGVRHLLYMRRVLRWPQARARIVRYWIKQEDEWAVYHPVFTFRTAEGKDALAISSSGAWHKKWPAGSEVLLHYDPQDPAHAELPSLLWSDLLAFAIVVPLAVAFATWMIYFFVSHFA